MKPVMNSTTGFSPDSALLQETVPRGRTRPPGVGITAGPAVRPQKRRGRSKRDASLEQRIEDLASRKSEFEANLRKPAGLLDAFFELIELMGSDSLTSSPGPAAACPR